MKKSLKMTAGLVAVSVGMSIGSMANADETKVILDGSTTVGPIAKAFAEYYMAKHKDVNVIVNESGSGNGAKSLINNECDIADMSRFMKNSEFKAAVNNGVIPVAHVIAMDGISMLVYPSNPVKELSIEQLRDIYNGKITNWKQVGGANLDIVVIGRDTNSGTYETFNNLVMTHKVNGKKVEDEIKNSAECAGSNGGIRSRVQTTPAAIGYTGLGFIDKTVKALKINGVYPTPATVSSGRYPISRPLFMFTNGYPKLGSDIFSLITLYLSEDGQEMIENIGFVPVTKY